MKVGVVSHLYPTKKNPRNGKFIKDHIDLLNAEKNVELELYVPTPYSIPGTYRHRNNNSQLDTPNVASKRVFYLSFPRRKCPQFIQQTLTYKFQSTIKHHNFDLIHIHWLHPDGMLIPRLKKLNIKTVLTIHGSDWYLTHKNPVLRDIYRQIFSDVNKVFYSGPKLKFDIEKIFPQLNGKSKILYNMVDPKKYYPISTTKKKALLAKLEWINHNINILTVANIRHEKGIDTLLDVAITLRKFRGIQFHLVGAFEPTRYSKEIQKRLIKDNIDNITLHKPVPPNQLVEYYQAADFYLLTSRREGFNVSILEAISCGLPVVSTDVSGIYEVADLGSGLVAKDTKDLALKVEQMTSDYSNYSKNDLHNTIIRKFGIEVFRKNLFDSYDEVIIQE